MFYLEPGYKLAQTLYSTGDDIIEEEDIFECIEQKKVVHGPGRFFA